MTTINPELVLVTTLGKRAGTPESISVKVADLPANVIERVLAYGFQRFINDPIGGKPDVADKIKAANAMIERMKRGEVGSQRGEAVDPFMTVVLRVVRSRVKAKAPDAFKKIAEMSAKDANAALLSIFNAQKPEAAESIKAEASLIRKQQEELADAKAKSTITIDL